MKKIFYLLITLAIISSCKKDNPEITLPALFTDHMVLQQKTETPVWGWATPESVIEISTSWNVKSSVTTSKNGKWIVKIPTPEAGGPYSIKISSGRLIKTIDDVYIGEVWLASGQSNMEMPVKGWGKDMTIDNSSKEIEDSKNSLIRMFTVEKTISDTPKNDCVGEWKISNPENTGDFSATAYFFAKNLYKNLKVPIGIIHSSWGGTPAEAWTSMSYIKKIKGFEGVDKQLNEAKVNQEKTTTWIKDLKKTSFDDALKNGFKDESSDKQYSASAYDDKDWKEMILPAYWESKQLKNFDGIVWFRNEFIIPNGTDLNDLKLYLGKIDDMDVVYINGEKVGETLELGFWDAERLYPINAHVLHTGKNSVSIKVIDNYGGGGIYGNKSIGIINSKNDTLFNLSGKWKFKPVGLFKDGHIYDFTKQNTYSNMPKSTLQLSQYSPTTLFNGMIAPLVPYAIKGVIWYQGESNVGRAKQYETLFPMMIKNWRAEWKMGDFPFYYVQIAPFKYSNQDSFSAAELRYAQFTTLKENNVGMVVTTDIGDVDDIHPSNKQDVGKRLSFWALNNTYGKDSIAYSGPLYKDVVFDKNKAIVSFTNIGEGLVSDGEKLNSFEIAGGDLVYYKAEAVIQGDKVIVLSKKVRKPKFVRFGWRNDAVPNLFNTTGLPASPFRN